MNGTPEVSGLLVFTLWEIQSGRIVGDTDGSDWWRAVNGSMMIDILRADRLLRREGGSARSSDPRVQAWIDYHHSPSGTSSAQEALWRAHQRSLHWAIDCYDNLLGQEEGAEQQFISTVVENVDLSSIIGFPSDGIGAAGMGNFLNGVPSPMGWIWDAAYPDYGDVTYANANPSLADLLLMDPIAHAYLTGANIIGLDSGWYWATEF